MGAGFGSIFCLHPLRPNVDSASTDMLMRLYVRWFLLLLVLLWSQSTRVKACGTSAFRPQSFKIAVANLCFKGFLSYHTFVVLWNLVTPASNLIVCVLLSFANYGVANSADVNSF